jgi:hypothetical protein
LEYCKRDEFHVLNLFSPYFEHLLVAKLPGFPRSRSEKLSATGSVPAVPAEMRFGRIQGRFQMFSTGESLVQPWFHEFKTGWKTIENHRTSPILVDWSSKSGEHHWMTTSSRDSPRVVSSHQWGSKIANYVFFW